MPSQAFRKNRWEEKCHGCKTETPPGGGLLIPVGKKLQVVCWETLAAASHWELELAEVKQDQVASTWRHDHECITHGLIEMHSFSAKFWPMVTLTELGRVLEHRRAVVRLRQKAKAIQKAAEKDIKVSKYKIK